MKLLAIVRANLVRTLRDRLALFFYVLLPLILILVLGLTYGSGSSVRIGVVDADGGTLASDLVAAISSTPGVTVEIRRYDSLAALRDASSRGLVHVGVAVPSGYTHSLSSGGTSSVTIVSPPTQGSIAIRTLVDAAVAHEVAVVRAARFAVGRSGSSFEQALTAARATASRVPGVAVTTEPVNAPGTSIGGYTAGAQSQLVLFMFLTSLTGAVELVLTRQLGISRRMFSTPTGPWTIIIGESLGRIAFALAQGVFIVAASALLFGVRWGDGPAVAAVVAVFALVAGGAAMIVGAVAANPSQAGALGPALGMLLGLLGGAMVPIDVFPETMRTIARLTPHAWAMDALSAANGSGASVLDILPQLGVLLAFAAVFFAIAVARFRRVLVGAAG